MIPASKASPSRNDIAGETLLTSAAACKSFAGHPGCLDGRLFNSAREITRTFRNRASTISKARDASNSKVKSCRLLQRHDMRGCQNG